MGCCTKGCAKGPHFPTTEVTKARIRVKLKRALRRRGGAYAWIPADIPTDALIRLTRES